MKSSNYIEKLGMSKRQFWWFAMSALLLQLILSWISKGFYHHDEYFQIWEFAAYKLGIASVRELPWEMTAQMRPSLQPWLAYLFLKAFALVGVENHISPMIAARMVSGVVGWAIAIYMIRHFAAQFTSRTAYLTLAFMVLFGSFLLQTRARFSSEIWSSYALLMGLVWIDKLRSGEQKSRSAFVIGLWLGLAFFFRYQTALFFPGIGLALLLLYPRGDRKELWSTVVAIVAGFVVLCLVNLLLDRIFYGSWALPYYQYFYQNLIRGVANQFGQSPWYGYLAFLLSGKWWFYAVLLLPLVVAGMLARQRSIWWLSALSFLLMHFIISHKEDRFLFPILAIVPVIVAFGIEDLGQRNSSWRRAMVYSFIIVVGCNAALLPRIFKAVRPYWTPLEEAHRLAYNKSVKHMIAERFAFSELREESLPMYLVEGRGWEYYYLPTANEKACDSLWGDLLLLDRDKVQVPDKEHKIWLWMRQKMSEKEPPMGMTLQGRLKFKEVFVGHPRWLESININGWQDRTTEWKIYELVP